jgi:hypothetical protein
VLWAPTQFHGTGHHIVAGPRSSACPLTALAGVIGVVVAPIFGTSLLAMFGG